MEKHFRDRLDYKGKIDTISKMICDEFNLGEFKSNKIVLQGYEDFNLILETSENKYFVKIFANFRNLKDCQRYIEIMTNAINSNISTPKLLESEQGFLHTISIGDSKLNLCVMEYISGTNFYESKKELTSDQIKFLVRQASLINSIELKPYFIYDSWAIVNFKKEFQKNPSTY